MLVVSPSGNLKYFYSEFNQHDFPNSFEPAMNE